MGCKGSRVQISALRPIITVNKILYLPLRRRARPKSRHLFQGRNQMPGTRRVVSNSRIVWMSNRLGRWLSGTPCGPVSTHQDCHDKYIRGSHRPLIDCIIFIARLHPLMMKENVMALVPSDPFGDVESLFNRLLPSRLAGWPRGALQANGNKLDWAPSANISETDKEYLIRAELPSVKKEDVKVLVDDGVITIKGERKQEREDKSEKYHRVESFYGSFERSFSLPDNVNADAIRCESKDGVLSVHIPKTETQKNKPKQISVQ